MRHGDSDCLDMLTVPVTWTLEAPWTGLAVSEAGDVNGDGINDVLATMWIEQEGADPAHASFLFGPVDRPVTLPSGEDLGLEGPLWTVSDVTGDGALDLVQRGGAVIAGPVDATTTSADSLGTIPDGRLVDLDGDGDLDLVKDSEDRLELWLGSWTGWHTEPPTTTLVVEPCDPESDPTLVSLADLDLDGIGEWWVASAWGCPHYQVPANTVGVVDVPTTFPLGTWQYPVPVGDQSGDGFTDHRVVNANGPEVLAAPMSFDYPTGWTGLSLGVQAEVDGNAPSPLGRSVIGDGFEDFALDIEDGLTLFAGGGPTSDAFTGTVTRTILGPNLSFSAEFFISVDDARTSARVTPIPADW